MLIKPLFIHARWLVRKGYLGFAFYPFIILKGKEAGSKRIINHERIHLAQQREMLVILFYIWYFSEYIIRRFQYSSWKEAYLNISFEREAFANESDDTYLKGRKFWTWTKFLNSQKNPDT